MNVSELMKILSKHYPLEIKLVLDNIIWSLSCVYEWILKAINGRPWYLICSWII